MSHQWYRKSKARTANSIRIEKYKRVGLSEGSDIKPGERETLIKYVALTTTLYYDRQELVYQSVRQSKEAKTKGWDNFDKRA